MKTTILALPLALFAMTAIAEVPEVTDFPACPAGTFPTPWIEAKLKADYGEFPTGLVTMGSGGLNAVTEFFVGGKDGKETWSLVGHRNDQCAAILTAGELWGSREEVFEALGWVRMLPKEEPTSAPLKKGEKDT